MQDDKGNTPAEQESQNPQAPVTPAEPQTPASVSVTPQTPTTPTPPDMEGIKKDLESSITEKVSKGVTERIAEALGITKKEEIEKMPQSREELLNLVKEAAQKDRETYLTEQEKQEQQAREQQEAQLQEGANRFRTLWTNQYNELAEKGLVPKIEKQDDKNDPGNLAKVKILTRLKQVIDENKKNGIDYVPTIKEIFYENPDILRTETQTGANAPVSGGGRSTAVAGGMPIDKLRKTSFEDLVAGQYNN